MKVVLHSIENTSEEGHPPLPIAYLYSYIKKYLPEVDIRVVDHVKDPLKEITKLKPDIVGISSTTLPYHKALSLARNLKKINPRIITIIGGHHISNLPHTLPKDFDIGVIGEGEEILRELLQNMLKNKELKNPGKIKGICFHLKDKIKINAPRPLIENLDDIPLPDRDVFDMNGYYLKPRRAGTLQNITRATHMFTSRGCPYNCVFCSSPRKKIRVFSPERVVQEMELLVEKYRVAEIAIADDLFVFSLDRLKKIVDIMKTRPFYKKVTFFCESRTDIFDEERAKILKEMNVKTIAFGFESGSEKELNYLKRNTTTVEMNKRACDLCHKYGFVINGYFIIGSPIQTREDLNKTINFIKENKINYTAIATATPFPGSDWWEYAKSKGIVDDFMDFKKFDTQARNTYFFMNEHFSRLEYEKIIHHMKHFEATYNFKVKFKLKDLFSMFIIKRAIKHPRRAFVYLKNSLFIRQ